MNIIDNFPDNNNLGFTGGRFDFREGDTIIVITCNGTFTGVFIRFQGNFVLWVRIIAGVPRFTLTSLDEISISRI